MTENLHAENFATTSSDPNDAFVACAQMNPQDRTNPDQLLLNLDGYEGPIDMLLELARAQKVDLAQISILALVDQYLVFIEQAQRIQLELAADYMVMAAWLIYLKSRLLLPDVPDGEEAFSGAELAALVTWQLQRLDAMRQAGKALHQLPQLHQDRLARGMPESIQFTTRPHYDTSLYQLLHAYATHRTRIEGNVFVIKESEMMSAEAALERLRRMLAGLVGWQRLHHFLPPDLQVNLFGKSWIAATFVASLELARQGQISLYQDKAFDPLYIRRRRPEGEDENIPPPDEIIGSQSNDTG